MILISNSHVNKKMFSRISNTVNIVFDNVENNIIT